MITIFLSFSGIPFSNKPSGLWYTRAIESSILSLKVTSSNWPTSWPDHSPHYPSKIVLTFHLVTSQLSYQAAIENDAPFPWVPRVLLAVILLPIQVRDQTLQFVICLNMFIDVRGLLCLLSKRCFTLLYLSNHYRL